MPTKSQIPQSRWVTCPNCHRPKPPEDRICEECQIRQDLREAYECIDQRSFGRALELTEKVCSLNGATNEQKAQAYHYRGVVFDEMGQEHQAQICWRTCVDLSPAHLGAKRRLAEFIIRKPPYQWDAFERLLIQTTGMEISLWEGLIIRVRYFSRWLLRKTALWSLRAVGSVAIIAAVWGLFLIGERVHEYITYKNEMQRIERMVKQGHLRDSMERFYNQFYEGRLTRYRKKAREELFPVIARAGTEHIQQGEIEQGMRLLELAAELDTKRQKELYLISTRLAARRAEKGYKSEGKKLLLFAERLETVAIEDEISVVMGRSVTGEDSSHKDRLLKISRELEPREMKGSHAAMSSTASQPLKEGPKLPKGLRASAASDAVRYLALSSRDGMGIKIPCRSVSPSCHYLNTAKTPKAVAARAVSSAIVFVKI
jgi:hypothetical protein